LSLATLGNYVYAASMVGNLEVIDVSNPTAPVDVGHAPSIFYPTSVTAANGYVYAESDISGRGFYVFSVSGATLTMVGNIPNISLDGYRMAVLEYRVIASREFGFKVVNVSNPASPSAWHIH